MWPKCKELGKEADDPGDLQQSDALLKAFIRAPDNTHSPANVQLTKWKLELAWRKVYSRVNNRKGKNLAEKELDEQQHQASKGAAGGSSAGFQKNKIVQGAWTRSGNLPNRPKQGPAAASSSLPVSGTMAASKQTSQPPSNFTVNLIGDIGKGKKAFHYRFPVLGVPGDSGHDHRVDQDRSGSQVRNVRVITNYVAVNKHPAKFYVYTMKYDLTKAFKSAASVKTDGSKGKSSFVSTPLSVAPAVRGSSQDDDGGREVKQRGEKHRIFTSLKQITPLAGHAWATDGETTWSLLPLEAAGIADSTTPIDTGTVEYTKQNGRRFVVDNVRFTYVRTLDIGSGSEATQALVNVDEVNEKGASLHITALNALISHHFTTNAATDDSPTGNIISVGPNKFFVRNGFEDITCLHANRGYFTSIRPGFNKVLLNVNTATAAFFKPMLVSSFIMQMRSGKLKGYGNPEDVLKGRIVRIVYDRGQHDPDYDPNEEHHRLKTIAGFGELTPDKQEFTLEDGSAITVAKYFESLGAKIEHSDLKCVNVGIFAREVRTRDPTTREVTYSVDQKTVGRELWIPPEFLEITRDQPFNRRLVGGHTEAMLKVALRHPAANQSLIVKEGLPLLGIGQHGSDFNKLELDIGSRLLEIPARFLAVPKILYAGNEASDVECASWNLIRKKFFRTPDHNVVPEYPLKKGVYTIDLRKNKIGGPLSDLGKQFTQKLKDHGFNVSNQALNSSKHIDAKTENSVGIDERTLQRVFEDQLRIKDPPRLFLVILEGNSSETYGSVKRIADQILGVHTVCVTTK